MIGGRRVSVGRRARAKVPASAPIVYSGRGARTLAPGAAFSRPIQLAGADAHAGNCQQLVAVLGIESRRLGIEGDEGQCLERLREQRRGDLPFELEVVELRSRRQ